MSSNLQVTGQQRHIGNTLARAVTQSTTRSHGRDGSAAPKAERNVFLGAHYPLATAAPRALPAVASHPIG
jgi:hypothetical protein